MGPRFDRNAPPEQPKHRINRAIRFHEVRVIGPEGEQLGVMSPEEGRERAQALGMDLVEVAPEARPPVCRILDYGKFKYLESKKAAKGTKTAPEIKTVQMRPKTDEHDLETKLKRAAKFLERGDKVRFVMRMRGRERAYPQRWVDQMLEHVKALGDGVRIAQHPSALGRAITMLVEPGPASAAGKDAAKAPPATAPAGKDAAKAPAAKAPAAKAPAAQASAPRPAAATGPASVTVVTRPAIPVPAQAPPPAEQPPPAE
jgi:translation initiation factor IF-3